MNRMKKNASLLLVMASMLASNCWNSSTGTFLIPNASYSGMMSNTNLRILTLTGKEGATGALSALSLDPVFDPNMSVYTVPFTSAVTAVTIEAIADDDSSTVRINSVDGTSRTIPTTEASMTVDIEVTAPDGVTRNSYLINFIRTYEINENRLLALEVSSEDDEAYTLNPGFHPDKTAYQLRVDWGDDYVTVRPRAINIYAIIKLNGKKVDSGEEELIILTIPKGDTTTTQTVTLSVTPGSGAERTYTLVLSRGVQPVASASDPHLEFIKVTMGNRDSARPLYQDMNSDFFPDNDSPFSKDVTEYSCAVFGFRAVTLTAQAIDPKVKSITVDGTPCVLTDGKATVQISLPDNAVKSVPILVTSQDSSATLTYTVNIRLLNIYEMYYGIYGPVSRANKASWGAPGTPNWIRTFYGAETGSMEWKLTWVQTLSTVENKMTYANYNNGDQKQPFVGENGFALNGIMKVIVNTSGTGQGPQTGDVTMLTPEGDVIAVYHINFVIVNKDAVMNNPDSYTDVDYMDQKGVRLYYVGSTAGKENLGAGKWDPDVPWSGNDFWHP